MFYDIGEVNSIEKPLRNSKIIFSTEIFLDASIIYHERSVYGLMQLCGDIGGVMGALQVFFTFFVEPYNETSFVLFVSNNKELKKTECESLGIHVLNMFKCFRICFPKSCWRNKLLYDK